MRNVPPGIQTMSGNGAGPVSENQMRSWSSLVSAYGLASGPPGTCHSFTSPVAGLIRPSVPRASSPNQIVPSLSTSSRRDRDVSAPSLKRVTPSVCGSIFAIMPTRSSATHTVPFESMTIPYGFEGVSFGVTRSTFSVAMFKRPTRFDPCEVNQMWPLPSNTIV